MEGEEPKKSARKKPVNNTDNTSNTINTPKSRTVPFDPIIPVIAKYTEFGWVAIRSPKNSLTDIIAQKDKRLHFVQVVTPETIDDVKFQGLPKNTFIQNAFSNTAVPVYAHVVTTKKKEITTKITFEDVNLNTRVIIGGNRRVGEEKK